MKLMQHSHTKIRALLLIIQASTCVLHWVLHPADCCLLTCAV